MRIYEIKQINGWTIRYNPRFNSYGLKNGDLISSAKTNGVNITWDFRGEIDLPNSVQEWILNHQNTHNQIELQQG